MSQLNLFDGPCEYCRTHSEEVLYSAEDGPCVHKKAENASRDCYSTPDRIYLPLHEEFQFTIDAAAPLTISAHCSLVRLVAQVRVACHHTRRHPDTDR